MASRNVLISGSVGAGVTHNTDSAVLPAGLKVVIRAVGGSDINNGDHKSSIFILQFGNPAVPASFVELAVFSLTGNTWHGPPTLQSEIVGDGVKVVRMTRVNTSAAAKRIPMWISAYS